MGRLGVVEGLDAPDGEVAVSKPHPTMHGTRLITLHPTATASAEPTVVHLAFGQGKKLEYPVYRLQYKRDEDARRPDGLVVLH